MKKITSDQLVAASEKLIRSVDALESMLEGFQSNRKPSQEPGLPPWLLLAMREAADGVAEVPGRSAELSNERIEQYHAVTRGGASPDHVPWCASAMCWVLEQCGIESPRSKRARSFEHWGTDIPAGEWQLGDIAVLSRSDNPRMGHVGLLMARGQQTITLLGGNQDDRWAYDDYHIGRLVSVRRPV